MFHVFTEVQTEITQTQPGDEKSNRNCYKIVELDWLSGRGPICHIIVSITKFSIVIGSPHVYLHVIDARSRGCPI